MGKVYSHRSEEERQVIQIEVGNGTSVRKMARLPGRSPSSISREIRRNTWFPSNESESCRPYRPKRLKTGPWTGRYYIVCVQCDVSRVTAMVLAGLPARS